MTGVTWPGLDITKSFIFAIVGDTDKRTVVEDLHTEKTANTLFTS